MAFEKLLNAVRKVSQKARAFLSRNQDTQTAAGFGTAGGTTFAIRTDIQAKTDNIRTRALVYFDSEVTTAFLQEVVKSAKIAVEQAFAPIRRTGEVQDSFQYKILTRNRQVVIYSDHPATSAIQQGYTKGGSIQKLMEWMEHKDEFKNKKESEKREIAFLIKRKIERGDPPGPQSTLRRLRPEGERRYDYMTRVHNQIARDVEIMLNEMANEANK